MLELPGHAVAQSRWQGVVGQRRTRARQRGGSTVRVDAAELGQQPAQAIDAGGALLLPTLTKPMYHQPRLLLGALHGARSAAGGWAHRGTDRGGVIGACFRNSRNGATNSGSDDAGGRVPAPSIPARTNARSNTPPSPPGTAVGWDKPGEHRLARRSVRCRSPPRPAGVLAAQPETTPLCQIQPHSSNLDHDFPSPGFQPGNFQSWHSAADSIREKSFLFVQPDPPIGAVLFLASVGGGGPVNSALAVTLCENPRTAAVDRLCRRGMRRVQSVTPARRPDHPSRIRWSGARSASLAVSVLAAVGVFVRLFRTVKSRSAILTIPLQ